jgi:CubicO group peptidase (beta-lactamase class C family)
MTAAATARLSPLLVCALAACGAAHTTSPHVPSGMSADVAAAIARVEHGLRPNVRIAGDHSGWSIAERLRAHRTPAVSIAVIHDHQLAWAKAYGVADVRTGQRVDADTLFQAASISKMVTGIVALQQAERGKVSLDADINQSLRSWKLPESELTHDHPVTLRRLLTHTGGINLHSVNGYPADAPLPTLVQILDGVPPANTAPVRVEYAPGNEYHYSGGGLIVVQQLIVDLARRPFAQAVSECLFAPLGLAHSTFAVPLSSAERAHSATAHDYDESVWPELRYPDAAPAGLWTTPSDLARLLVEVQRGLQGRSKLISPAMAKAMTEPVAPIGVPDVWTGAGTFVERHGHTMYFGHDGRNLGYLSVSRATTTGGEGAVVMANGDGGVELILEILRSIAAEYHWDGWLTPVLQPVRLDVARLRAFAGRYGAGLDRSVLVEVVGDQLELREPFREPRRLVAITDDTFVGRLDGARVQFRGAELVETPLDGEAAVMTRLSERSVEPLRLLESGRDDVALAQYQVLLAQHPTDRALAEGRFDELASDLLERRFDIARAIQIFKIEVALYPSSASANAGLALAFLRAGKKSEAAPFHARALALRSQGKRSEIEDIYLGARLARLQRLAAGAR